MQIKPSATSRGKSAFTLAETLISIAIMGLVFGGTLMGYTRATERAEWAGYSLAAQAQASRMLEQFHAVVWDPLALPPRDDTTNIPMRVITVLDIPMSGTNAVYATNVAVVSTLTLTNSTATIKMIQINTTWPWKNKTFTNTLVTYRSPDQ